MSLPVAALVAVLVLGGLIAILMWRHTHYPPCLMCHGTGMQLTDEDYAKAPGFGMPDGPPCPQCAGRG